MKNKSRRLLLKGIWVTPIINAVSLPAHAQTSPDPSIQLNSLSLQNDPTNSNNKILSFLIDMYSDVGAHADISGVAIILPSSRPRIEVPFSTFRPVENIVIEISEEEQIIINIVVLYQGENLCKSLTIPGSPMSYDFTDLRSLTNSCGIGVRD